MKKWKKVATAALAAMVFASVLSGCGGDKKKAADNGNTIKAVSYTHLTLPTTSRV